MNLHALNLQDVSAQGLDFIIWIFLKHSWGSAWAYEGSIVEILITEYLKVFGWFLLACGWGHCFAEEAGNTGGFFLVPDPLRSLPSCLLDTPQSLALCFSGWWEPPRTTCSDVGLTIVKDDWSPGICFFCPIYASWQIHRLTVLSPPLSPCFLAA